MPRKRSKTPSSVKQKSTKKSVESVEALQPKLRQTRGSGIVLTCGQGDCGQLGLGADIMERTRFALVPHLTDVVDITAGGMHTLCLTNDGEIYSWGCNDEGALGRDTSIQGTETIPIKLDLHDEIIQISAGDSHSAALSKSGKVFAWGSFRDSHGTMGLTLRGNENIPIHLMDNGYKICSGTDHLLILTNSGKLYSLGCAEQGQLGRIPERSIDRGSRGGIEKLLTPGLVLLHPRITYKFIDAWSVPYGSFVKERIGGTIYAFGLNNFHQLGLDKDEKLVRPMIVKSFATDKQWVDISGGQHHTLALDNLGRTYTLGRKEYGRLGLGKNCEDTGQPTIIPTLQTKNVVSVSCGNCVSFAVTNQGDAYGWGMCTTSQLGCGDEDEDVYEPMLIKSKQLESRSVIKISAGGQHTVILAKEKS